MSMTVSTAKELGQAICSNESQIIITGSLGDVVIKIEAIGSVAWLIATGAVGGIIAGVCVSVGSGGAAVPAGAAMHLISIPTAAAACGGISVVTVLCSLAAAGGGIGTLHALRKYQAKREGDHVVLTTC